MTTGASKYKQTAVATASKGQILLMLYEAAIRNVKRAIEAMEKNDRTTRGEAIGKTHDIINELSNSLNFDVGGEIAVDLERLYNYMTEQLLKANLENSPEGLKGVLKVLETLLSAWRTAVEQVNKATAGISTGQKKE